MKIGLEALEAAGLDMEEVRRGWALMNSLRETGPEGRKNRLLLLRTLAGLARKNAAAHSTVAALLDVVGGELPEEAATFRACYLEGDTKPNARQISRSLHVVPETVHRHNRRILSSMLAPAFGVYGHFQTDRERERELGGDRNRHT